MSFLHRFGSALNVPMHFHCCVIDGLFEPDDPGQARFREAALPADVAERVQARVRARVLRWFVRRGWLDASDQREMAQWDNAGGFSVDAGVRLEAWDRDGLERLLRYCARPPFALERLQALTDDRLVYRFPKPRPDGRTELVLSPLELIDRLAGPPPIPGIAQVVT